MSDLKLFNSYTRKIEIFKPINEGKVDIYYCGPTVYNYVHLGNFRPTITFDLLARLFIEIGYDVKVVSNYTDIDDKIIKQAKIENKSEKELSEFYIDSYESCLKKLNVLPLYAHPRASEYIDKMADFIAKLENTGFAYRSGDDIYFRVKKIKNFGILSNQTLDSLKAGARIDVNDKKENPFDFALWKLTNDDGIKYDTILGKGRPGWHTECVVMVNSVFNKPLIDIHGGGFDLKFPHHENEIAQSEAINNTRLANYWMHVGFLLTNGEKMSKSLNNFILAKDVLEKFSGNTVRFFFLQTHYRAPLNYTLDNLNQAESKVNKYFSSLKKAKYKLQLSNIELINTIDQSDYESFIDALKNDLNVSNALAIIDKDIKVLNSLILNKTPDFNRVNVLFNTLNKLFDILGFDFKIDDLTKDDIDAFNRYNKAREEKDFITSDSLRDLLMKKGIL